MSRKLAAKVVGDCENLFEYNWGKLRNCLKVKPKRKKERKFSLEWGGWTKCGNALSEEC